jgi:hypothetical protein
MWGFYAKPAGAAGRYPSRERQLPPVPHPPGAHQEGLIEGFSERPVEPCCSGLRRQPGRRAARCVGMHINKRGRLTGLVLLGAAASVLTVGCFTASAAPIPAPSLAGTVTVALPVVHCPTTFGAPPARRVSLPATRQVAVPRAMAARLSVYADTQGYMYLVAPKGWSCSASYGADGSGGVAVYPHGQKLPASWGAGWRLASTSTVSAVVGQESSACYGGTLAQACRLFPAAAATLVSSGFRPCPARPSAEQVKRIGSGIALFADPPWKPAPCRPVTRPNAPR